MLLLILALTSSEFRDFARLALVSQVGVVERGIVRVSHAALRAASGIDGRRLVPVSRCLLGDGSRPREWVGLVGVVEEVDLSVDVVEVLLLGLGHLAAVQALVRASLLAVLFVGQAFFLRGGVLEVVVEFGNAA